MDEIVKSLTGRYEKGRHILSYGFLVSPARAKRSQKFHIDCASLPQPRPPPRRPLRVLYCSQRVRPRPLSPCRPAVRLSPLAALTATTGAISCGSLTRSLAPADTYTASNLFIPFVSLTPMNAMQFIRKPLKMDVDYFNNFGDPEDILVLLRACADIAAKGTALTPSLGSRRMPKAISTSRYRSWCANRSRCCVSARAPRTAASPIRPTSTAYGHARALLDSAPTPRRAGRVLGDYR